jgi:uncharacterized glyoxalase superfamily protein PhnB
MAVDGGANLSLDYCMKTNPIPDGCHAITPYLHAPDAARLIEFMKRAFGGVEHFRAAGPDGKVMHAQVRIGDSLVMVGEPHDAFQARPAILYHYVADVEAVYQSAVAAGAETMSAPMNMFYGDRVASVKDFAGNQWFIATHIEDVPAERIQQMMISFRQQKAKNPA